ncbi:hypothetical protein Z043_125681 [Scleropages formosus]|uniref:Uncharacterized protein n=1 Tax=Scleropages formosus TaxID=113540 RepID=A0A0P7UD22_SCLFO|nr:hypothetical protein Z043_125681 [Scleropages formosus]
MNSSLVQNAVEPHVTSILRPALLQMCWSGFLCALVSLPLSIFPSVQDTGHHFGLTAPAIFGAPIPITCVVSTVFLTGQRKGEAGQPTYLCT